MNEFEAKFLIASGRRPKRVLRRVIQELSWAGYLIRPEGEFQVSDRYFDTKNWCLHRSGWTYRLREAGGRRTLTLKQLAGGRGALFERREIEQPAPEAEPNHPQPGPVAAQLDDLLGNHHATLKGLFVLDNRRTRYQLTHPAYAGDVIELSLDRVRIDAKLTMQFAELEFELRHGGAEFLKDLMPILCQQSSLIEARVGKFQRGLFAAGCAPREPGESRSGDNGDSRWVDVGRHYLAGQFELLKSWEPFAWEAVHPEGVHQTRVVTRRIRSALDVFAPVLPKVARASLSKDVRAFCRELGCVRDLDVHLEHLEGYRKELSFTERKVLASYQQELQKRRQKSHRQLIEYLRGPAYAKLQCDYEALLDLDAYRAESGRVLSVRDASRAYLKPQLERILEDGASITPRSSPAALHRLRIDVKRLRYQIEHSSAANGRSCRRANASLRRLQVTLGRHQDSLLARKQLAGYRRKNSLRRSGVKSFKKLVQLEEQSAERWRKRFGRDWQAFETDAKRLKKALS